MNHICCKFLITVFDSHGNVFNDAGRALYHMHKRCW